MNKTPNRIVWINLSIIHSLFGVRARGGRAREISCTCLLLDVIRGGGKRRMGDEGVFATTGMSLVLELPVGSVCEVVNVPLYPPPILAGSWTCPPPSCCSRAGYTVNLLAVYESMAHARLKYRNTL